MNLKSSPPRMPYPYQIIDNTGSSFCMAAIGGTAFYFLKGICNSPKRARLICGTESVIMNVPRVAGSFGRLGATFSVVECITVYARHKEDGWNTIISDDGWNSIISGSVTGGLLEMRRGLRPAMWRALWYGGLVALAKGADILLNRFATARQYPLEAPRQYDPPASPPPPPPPPSWYGRIFEGKS